MGLADGLRGIGDFAKAARLCPKVCAHVQKRWEDWIFVFAEKHQLQVSSGAVNLWTCKINVSQAIIPFVPTESPRLDHLVYEMMLAHFLTHDHEVPTLSYPLAASLTG